MVDRNIGETLVMAELVAAFASSHSVMLTCTLEDGHLGIYRKLVLDKTGKHLLGAVLVGDTGQFGILDQYFSNRLTPVSYTHLTLPTNREV